MDDVSKRRETIKLIGKVGKKERRLENVLARTCPAFRLLTGTCADV